MNARRHSLLVVAVLAIWLAGQAAAAVHLPDHHGHHGSIDGCAVCAAVAHSCVCGDEPLLLGEAHTVSRAHVHATPAPIHACWLLPPAPRSPPPADIA